jgi:type I restriction enzyme S subunit
MNWRTEKFRDIAKVVYGKGLPKKARNLEGDFPVFGSGGEVGRHSESLVNQPTLVLARKGSIGNTFRVKSPSWPIDTVYYLENVKLDLDYLYYFLTAQRFKNTATTIPSLRREDLEKIDVSFPENEKEQREIVAVLEAQFTRLDAAIKSLKTIKAKLETYRQSVLKAAFEGKIINVFKWAKVNVKDLGEIVTGTTPSTTKKEYYGKDYCFFKPTDLNSGYRVQSSREMLSSEGIKHARILPAKSILVTCIGATIGKTGLSRTEGATNQQINAVIPDKKFCPEFLYYFFISKKMQKQIAENASSTTLPLLNKTKFMRLELTVPFKIAEQENIVAEIESRFSVIDKVEEAVDSALLKADRLRKSILKAAFEGKLIEV